MLFRPPGESSVQDLPMAIRELDQRRWCVNVGGAAARSRRSDAETPSSRLHRALVADSEAADLSFGDHQDVSNRPTSKRTLKPTDGLLICDGYAITFI
jgi:hypothetical protein